MNEASFGKRVFADDWVKLKSLGWALIQRYYVLIKRRNLDTQTDVYRVKIMWRREKNTSPSQETPEATRSWDRGREQIFPHSTEKEQTVLLTPWLQTSSLQNCQTINFCCLRQQKKKKVLWHFVMAAAGNEDTYMFLIPVFWCPI